MLIKSEIYVLQDLSPYKKMDIVVKADPSAPPKSLPLICQHLQKKGRHLNIFRDFDFGNGRLIH